MLVAVVYESVFGNSEAIAQAIAHGIREAAPGTAVECVHTDDASADLGRADLLVVGGPTHFLGMPSPRSRRIQQQKAEQGAWHHDEEDGARPVPPGVREWLDALPAAGRGHRAAAFDTRLGTLMAGSAARQITRILRRRGYQMIDRPQGFVVEDYGGPLAEGELDRAHAWGAALAAQLGVSAAPSA